MKVIEAAAKAQTENEGLLNRVRESISASFEQKERNAQDALIAVLGRTLDNRYSMLRGVMIEGLDMPIPLVLIGPFGVQVITASPLTGLFRAREDTWEKLDDRTQKYQPVRPNLLVRTRVMAQTVQAFLAARQYNLETVDPVLFFAEPGFHVEATRPVVRLVLRDAVERYASGLLQSPPFLRPETVQQMAVLLAGERTAPAETLPAVTKEDAFSFREDPEEKKAMQKKAEKPPRPSVFEKIPFTTRQWIFLIILTLITLAAMVALTVFILLTR